MKRCVALVCTFACLLLNAQTLKAQDGERIQQTIAAMAQGNGSAQRAGALTSRLKADGISWETEDFVDPRMRKGTNIVVTLPGRGAGTLLLGAHYDRVAVGQGALDNGAACAVLLELIETFKRTPLRNMTLRFVFFDLEEGGLFGSQAYLSTPGPIPSYGLNLDVFGYGNTFFATASNPDGALAKALKDAAAERQIPVRLFPPGQYPDSDHVSMIRAGIETVGLSLLDGDEIDNLVGAVNGKPITAIPAVLSTIHTVRDTPQVLRVQEMTKAIPVLEKFLRQIDAP